MKKKDYKKDVLDEDYKKDVLDVIKEYKRKNKGKIKSIKFENINCCAPYVIDNVCFPIKIKIEFVQGFIDWGCIEIFFKEVSEGGVYIYLDYCYESKNNNFIQEKEDESNKDKKVTELNNRIPTNIKESIVQGIDVFLAERDFYERKWSELVYQKK